MEDKKKILELLLPTLQATRSLKDLDTLEYSDDGFRETVTATFKGGYRKTVNVTIDSGISMIRDIIRKIS